MYDHATQADYAEPPERNADIPPLRVSGILIQEDRWAAMQRERRQLRDALEKHHWPDLVPGDGPCETCGLRPEAWYET